ncbi:MAG TPA: FAD/NAD(P)-binding protein [Polyangia bacterium]|nr:FAD/NAD(P)-binding protein [Polyangia bacterium]
MTPPLPPMPAPLPSPFAPEPLRIARIRQETDDTFTLHLDVSGRKDGFRFAPGQFNMLYVFGVGEVAISISGDPERPEALVHTVRAVGAVTRAMQELGRGAMLGVRGPYGVPWPLAEARGKDVLLVTGGVGLAPLRPALYYLLHHRKEYGQVALLVGARTPENLLYRQELERWRKRRDLQVLVTVDRAGPEWTGDVGVVPALVPLARFDPARTIAMVCGPEVMLRFTVRELHRHGVTDEQIHFSMERNMKCAMGLCGRCQFGPDFICKDGPVLRYDRIRDRLMVREL